MQKMEDSTYWQFRLYYETQNTAILPDKVTPPQPASHPASITFNDKTHLSLREAPAAPIHSYDYPYKRKILSPRKLGSVLTVG